MVRGGRVGVKVRGGGSVILVGRLGTLRVTLKVNLKVKRQSEADLSQGW